MVVDETSSAEYLAFTQVCSTLAVQDPAGNTFMVARDASNALWVNEFRTRGGVLRFIADLLA